MAVWLSEAFKMEEERAARKALDALWCYADLIRNFKYKHVYTTIRAMVSSWRDHTFLSRRQKINCSEFAKLRNSTVSSRVLSAWNSLAQRAQDCKKRAAIVKMQLRSETMLGALRVWEEKWKTKADMRGKMRFAEDKARLRIKRKGFRGWILFTNRRYGKYERYGRYLQVHYKRVLRGLLGGWNRIVANKAACEKVKQTVAARRGYHSKHQHWAVWHKAFKQIADVFSTPTNSPK